MTRVPQVENVRVEPFEELPEVPDLPILPFF